MWRDSEDSSFMWHGHACQLIITARRAVIALNAFWGHPNSNANKEVSFVDTEFSFAVQRPLHSLITEPRTFLWTMTWFTRLFYCHRIKVCKIEKFEIMWRRTVENEVWWWVHSLRVLSNEKRFTTITMMIELTKQSEKNTTTTNLKWCFKIFTRGVVGR